jgi:ferric-dicitrate binding protein FerR (iron transport regulator)
VAAALLLVAGAGILYYFINKGPGEITLVNVQSNDAVKKDTLPDGSFVTLNKASEISYPSRFSKQEREVQLKGEAFFSVTPNKAKPFVVLANNIQVEVVGTSFNVRSKGDTTEIIVETGIVRVTRRQQTVTLGAGEKILIYAEESVLQKTKSTDQLYNYYRSRKFICDSTPLWRLVEILNEAYDAHIEIGNPELRDLKITVIFNDESLDNILEIIRISFDINVEMQQDRVILH